MAALLLLAQVLAAGPSRPVGTPPAITDLRGHFSASFYHSGIQGGNVAYGGSEGVLAGFTIGAALAFKLDGLKVDLNVDQLALTRQNLALSVTGDVFSSRLSFVNIPPVTAGDERRSDFTVNNTLRLPGLPNATFGFTRKGGSGDGSNLSFSTSLSDSYRDLSPDLQGLSWQAGYRLGSHDRVGQTTRSYHDVQLRLNLDVTERNRSDVRFRPGFAVQLRQDAAAATRFKQRYTFTLDSESSDGLERLGLKLDFEADSQAEPRTQQSVTYSTDQFGPLTVTGGFSADQRDGVRKADYRVGVGFGLSDALRFDGGYHGRTGTSQTSNGVEASVQYRYTIRPWYLSARADGDLQFVAGGGIDPSARLNLNLRYQGEPFAATGSAHLNYGQQGWRGRVEFSGDYQLAEGGLSLTAGVLLAKNVAANLSVSGHKRIAAAWSIQGSGDYRIEFAEDIKRVYTLGMGLRYDFGGE
jgi:hypothetical protein